MTLEKVLCIDDRNPNPLCRFPCGYVVQGHVYEVVGIGRGGGIQIAGLPVFYLFFDEDAGWKPHRFSFLGEGVPDEYELTEAIGVSR